MAFDTVTSCFSRWHRHRIKTLAANDPGVQAGTSPSRLPLRAHSTSHIFCKDDDGDVPQ